VLLLYLCLVSFPCLDITMSGRRSVSRVRTRRGAATPEVSPERISREIDLDGVDPERMLEHLRATGHLGDANLGPSGSGVPPQAAVEDASTRALASMEAMFQRTLGSGTHCSVCTDSVNGSIRFGFDDIYNREAPSQVS
jgi:hypothetical protein